MLMFKVVPTSSRISPGGRVPHKAIILVYGQVNMLSQPLLPGPRGDDRHNDGGTALVSLGVPDDQAGLSVFNRPLSSLLSACPRVGQKLFPSPHFK